MPDIPARVGLQLMGWRSDKPIEKALEYFAFDFEHAKPLELVSYYQLFTRGQDFFVTDQRGLWSLYENLYKPVNERVLFQRTVERIKYSDHSVVIQTENKETFVADYALCTFSTGVLASGSVTFNPPLPSGNKKLSIKTPCPSIRRFF